MKKLLLPILLAGSTICNAQYDFTTNVNPGNADANPATLHWMNGKMYFAADDGTNGTELWVYDPSTNISSLVYNINGSSSGLISGAQGNDYYGTVLDNKLYFLATDGTTGNELWVYDGVNAPTMAAEIFPGITGSAPRSFVTLNGKLYFSAIDDVVGPELMEYDPATNTVNPMSDVNPGNISGNCDNLTVFNGKIYFTALNSANTGNELYVFDPANLSVTLVADIYPGTTSSSPSMLVVANNKLYFAATSATWGTELYSYTGTGTPIRLTDINTGSGHSISTVGGVPPCLFNNKLYFAGQDGSSGYELYAMDLSNNTVAMVADINSGSSGSMPAYITAYGNRLFFSADNGTQGKELWRYDGVNAPTMVLDYYLGSGDCAPSHMLLVGDTLYLAAEGIINGRELYKFYDAVAANVPNVDVKWDVKVYPQPASAEATIEISLPNATSLSVGLFDMTGKKIYTIRAKEYQQGSNKITMPLTKLATGNYFYRLSDRNGTTLATGNIVKQ